MEGSEEKFAEARNLFPGIGEVFNYHGEILLDQKKFEEALSRFNQAIEVSSSNPLPYINIAVLYLQWNSDAVEAEKQCRKAIECDPLCDIAYTQLAQILCQQNKVPEALEVYEKAIEVTRTEVEVMNVVSCREATKVQEYIAKNYPEALKQMAS